MTGTLTPTSKYTTKDPGNYTKQYGYRNSAYPAEKRYLNYERVDYLGRYSRVGGSNPVSNQPLSGFIDAGLPELVQGTGGALYAKAYDSFYRSYQRQTTGQAQLGMAMLEARSSYTMVLHRLGSLAKSVNYFRKGDLFSSYKALVSSAKSSALYKGRGKPTVNLRNALKQPADLYLETIFGWGPLLQDIWTAIEVLQRDIEPVACYGSARLRVMDVETVTVDHAVKTTRNAYADGWMRIKALSSVTNPNLELATRLGLTNPAYILWDAIPGSFLLDSVVNVGRFFARASDFWGVTLYEIHKTGGYKAHADIVIDNAAGYEVTTMVQDESMVYRGALSSLPTPFRLQGQLPVRGLASRIVTLTALITQNLTRR